MKVALEASVGELLTYLTDKDGNEPFWRPAEGKRKRAE